MWQAGPYCCATDKLYRQLRNVYNFVNNGCFVQYAQWLLYSHCANLSSLTWWLQKKFTPIEVLISHAEIIFRSTKEKNRMKQTDNRYLTLNLMCSLKPTFVCDGDQHFAISFSCSTCLYLLWTYRKHTKFRGRNISWVKILRG